MSAPEPMSTTLITDPKKAEALSKLDELVGAQVLVREAGRKCQGNPKHKPDLRHIAAQLEPHYSSTLTWRGALTELLGRSSTPTARRALIAERIEHLLYNTVS